MAAIDDLRDIVELFNQCDEEFNSRLTLTQIIGVYYSWKRSSAPVFPDKWTPRQIADAAAGIDPRWDDDGHPVYVTK